MQLLGAVGRKLSDVEGGRLGAAVVSVGEPVHEHALPARPGRNGRIKRCLAARCLVHVSISPKSLGVLAQVHLAPVLAR
jgi:hypothetical protein